MKYKNELMMALFLSTTAQADVPHVFKPNTPAKAVEVNENFIHIDSKLDNLEKKLDELDNQALKNLCLEQTTPLWGAKQPVYEPINVAVGSKIVIEGVEYKLIKMPFIEYSTGDVYTITLPAELEEINGKSEVKLIYISTNYNFSGSDCSNLTISGYSANFQNPYVNSTYVFSQNSNSSLRLSDNPINLSTSIIINETTVGFSLSTSLIQTSLAIDLDDSDLSKDFIESNYSKSDLIDSYKKMYSIYDDFIDYIFIEKVSK